MGHPPLVGGGSWPCSANGAGERTRKKQTAEGGSSDHHLPLTTVRIVMRRRRKACLARSKYAGTVSPADLLVGTAYHRRVTTAKIPFGISFTGAKHAL